MRQRCRFLGQYQTTGDSPSLSLFRITVFILKGNAFDLSLTPQKLKLLNFKGLKGSFLGVPLQLTIYGNYLTSPVLVQESEALLP